MAKDPKHIEKPKEATAKKVPSDYTIHVMPKEFKGKTALLAQPKTSPKPAPPLPPVPAKKPEPPLKTKAKVKKKGRRSMLVLIAVGIFILVLFFLAAYFVLQTVNQPVEEIGEEDTEAVLEEEEEEPEMEEEDVEPLPALDTDSDGLTDIEETLYGTDYRNPDTDADTFLDGNEVFHRYDPLGFAPSTLLDTGSVKVFTSSEAEPFSLYYPSSWTANESFDPGTGETSRVMLETGSSASFRITMSPKSARESFEGWYEDHAVNGVDVDSLMPILSKAGYAGFMSRDERITYLDVDDAVYIFVYDLGEESTIQFLQTFQMLVNSFSRE